MRTLVAIATLLVTAGCSREEPQAQPESPPQASSRPSPYGEEFWQVWGDGKAEAAAYRLRNSRGAGGGIGILVFAAKSGDNPSMKLSAIRESPPGIAGRRTMSTVVTALAPAGSRPAGAITEVTFSTQDMSGHAWLQMLLGQSLIHTMVHGNSRGFAGIERSLPYPETAVPEEALPLCARRMAWPRLRLGQTYEVSMLSSLEHASANNEPQAWSKVRLSLSADRHTVQTPAGSFRTHVFRVARENGQRSTWHVEGDPPYRIVRWESSDGNSGEMLGAARAALHELRDSEETLRRLGIEPHNVER
jgi:hypothetical protein